MEKKEKLKAVAAAAESFNLTAEEVIRYLGQNSIQSEKANSVDIVCPGMYFYSDGMISADVLPGKQISGIVGWVDESGKHGLVLGLRETNGLAWIDDKSFYVGASNKKGKDNTYLLLKEAQEHQTYANAAAWCVKYDFDGVRAGEAFLPSKDELANIFKNLGAIQTALGKIDQPKLQEKDAYWSSSESKYEDYYDPSIGCHPYPYAYIVIPSRCYMERVETKYSNSPNIRCVLAF